jgi:hypothetical protein
MQQFESAEIILIQDIVSIYDFAHDVDIYFYLHNSKITCFVFIFFVYWEFFFFEFVLFTYLLDLFQEY